MADQMTKLRRVFDLVGGEVDIEVDGGLNHDTVETCAAAGANAIVAGSYVFAAKDVREPLERLRAGWARGAARLAGADCA
jgi:ribulose-phosphate 3-epimerase